MVRKYTWVAGEVQLAVLSAIALSGEQLAGTKAIKVKIPQLCAILYLLGDYYLQLYFLRPC
ncbi:hypothetical protein D0Y50_06360 [Salinimonas sediminis]|uniref:Uncharacterized protein n=1 Tax=Salinimonas sediminis TaxID=2303538 RepID=A0A346NKH2_9ALTE|nr:hypothetical protein D0Y50_06360 [Salinimonas sediminis]